ncbi:MAG: class I SAM-dependent methyltransferase [Endomicrobium sp.]|nr:class I SAM-dependent methyltransferase [Endomicrobium sp.]
MKYNKEKNIDQFNKDLSSHDHYLYHGDKLSSVLSNTRQFEGLTSLYNFENKRILDIGSGDGLITLQIAKLKVKSIVGVDPASKAVSIANEKAKSQNLDHITSFINEDIYNHKITDHFDCGVFCRVLHHLSDPQAAISAVAPLVDNILILEPNGANLILKILEKTSKYHIEHDEKSYLSSTIKKWVINAGFKDLKSIFINLVPTFCPDFLAKTAKFVEPLIESLPGIRILACGQYVLFASK